jgi:hypothetical protein
MNSPEHLNLAKAQARTILIECAKARRMITYSEQVANLNALPMHARDPRLFRLLEEISREEDVLGRGLLSALVVHKVGDMEPSTGFFELAKDVKRDTSDRLDCWINEVKRVFRTWDGEPRSFQHL